MENKKVLVFGNTDTDSMTNALADSFEKEPGTLVLR